MRAAEGGEQMRQADRRALAPRVSEEFGLVDVPADPEDKDRRQQADREQHAPGDRLGQKGVERGVDERRGAPADGPAGLHDADSAPTIFVADHLAHQHGARRPFAAEAKPVQCPQDEELLEILGEGAQKGEDGVPQDRDLQHSHPAEPVGQGPGEPAAQ
jgi:hypothetical protein